MGISIRNRDVQIIFVEELTEHMAENAAFRCRREEVDVTSSLIDSKDISSMFNHFQAFFPRAYERRVLLIAGVCYTSSHLLIFTSSSSHLHRSSSHLRIFIFTSSHLHMCTSSHIFSLSFFASSHLDIFTLSPYLSLAFSLSLFLSLSLSFALCDGLSPSFSFLSLGCGQC